MAKNAVLISNEQESINFSEQTEMIIKSAVNESLLHMNFPYEAEVNVLLVDNADIKIINCENRGIDAATDVLSFPMLEYDENYRLIEDSIEVDLDQSLVILGDIVLSLEKALEQALEYGHAFEREVAYLVVHSMLHLMGYDHIAEADKAVMREKEEEILLKLNLTR